jgi:hypothetical protein
MWEKTMKQAIAADSIWIDGQPLHGPRRNHGELEGLLRREDIAVLVAASGRSSSIAAVSS